MFISMFLLLFLQSSGAPVKYTASPLSTSSLSVLNNNSPWVSFEADPPFGNLLDIEDSVETESAKSKTQITTDSLKDNPPWVSFEADPPFGNLLDIEDNGETESIDSPPRNNSVGTPH
jgi:hypothetical protein